MPVKLAFYKGPENIFGKAIRLWTWGPYSHVEIMIDDVSFSAINGVGTRYLSYPVFQNKDWDFIDIPTDVTEKAHMWAWCMSEMRCDYDWKGIWLAQVLGLRKQDPEKWFCSEFCTAAMQIIGRLKGVKPYAVSPNGLYRLLKKSK
jgi:hypothetical protein